MTSDIIRSNLTMPTKQNNSNVISPSIPPQNFPDSSANNSAVHFYKNSTIEQQFLLHNRVIQNNGAPLKFPEHNSNTTVFKTNETILRKLLHESPMTSTTQASPTTPQPVTTRLLPPVTFPTDADKYKIITNKAQEEKFLAVSKNLKASKVDTEVSDLLSKKTYDGKFDTDQINPAYILKKETEERGQEIVVDPKNHQTQSAEKELARGPMAGLMIGILLTIAMFGYITLVLWRRALE